MRALIFDACAPATAVRKIWRGIGGGFREGRLEQGGGAGAREGHKLFGGGGAWIAVQQPALELDHPARMATRSIQVHLHSVLSVYAKTVTKQQSRKLARTHVEAPLPVLP